MADFALQKNGRAHDEDLDCRVNPCEFLERSLIHQKIQARIRRVLDAEMATDVLVEPSSY
jgi:hypothetical protein